MLKSKAQVTVASNAREAARDILKLSENEKNKISFVFPAPSYNADEFIDELNKNKKNDKLVGFTTRAMMTKDGCITNESGFAGILTIQDDALTVGVAGATFKASARETGRAAAQKALDDAGMDFAPDYFFMSATDDEEQYLKGVQDVIGRVPIFGGSPSKTDDHYLYCQDGVIKKGLILAFFYSDKEINTKYSAMYNETKKIAVATKVSDDDLLVELNGQAALDVYAKMLGKTVEEVKENIYDTYVLNPLGVSDRLGDLISLRSLLGTTDEGAMKMGAKLAENTALIMMEKNPLDILDDTETIVKFLKATVNKAGAYLLFNNISRSFIVQNNRDDLVKKLNTVIANVPFLMPVTSVEYGYADDQNNSVGNLMMSFTVFEK